MQAKLGMILVLIPFRFGSEKECDVRLGACIPSHLKTRVTPRRPSVGIDVHSCFVALGTTLPVVPLLVAFWRCMHDEDEKGEEALPRRS
jgi:hypothetical protein